MTVAPLTVPTVRTDSEAEARLSGTTLTIDTFGIAAAFVRGLLDPQFGATELTLHPRLPAELDFVTQKFPVRWGSAQLFFTLQHGESMAVSINGTACSECVPPSRQATSTCKHHDDMSKRSYVIAEPTVKSVADCCDACGKLAGCVAYTFAALGAEPGCFLSNR